MEKWLSALLKGLSHAAGPFGPAVDAILKAYDAELATTANKELKTMIRSGQNNTGDILRQLRENVLYEFQKMGQSQAAQAQEIRNGVAAVLELLRAKKVSADTPRKLESAITEGLVRTNVELFWKNGFVCVRTIEEACKNCWGRRGRTRRFLQLVENGGFDVSRLPESQAPDIIIGECVRQTFSDTYTVDARASIISQLAGEAKGSDVLQLARDLLIDLAGGASSGDERGPSARRECPDAMPGREVEDDGAKKNPDPWTAAYWSLGHMGPKVSKKIIHMGGIAAVIRARPDPSGPCLPVAEIVSCELHKDSLGLVEGSRDYDGHAARMLGWVHQLELLKLEIRDLNMEACYKKTKSAWREAMWQLEGRLGERFFLRLCDVGLCDFDPEKPRQSALCQAREALSEIMDDADLYVDIEGLIGVLERSATPAASTSAATDADSEREAESRSTLFGLEGCIQRIQNEILEAVQGISEALAATADCIAAGLGQKAIAIVPTTRIGRHVNRQLRYTE